MFLDYEQIMSDGISISSSGTTGSPKIIYRSPENLNSCLPTLCTGQNISKNSRVYTVTRLTHAGGSLLQTLPALHVGASVDIEQFNPYTFVKKIKNYTHTFLPPQMMREVMKTKGWKTLDLTGIRVLGGSDRVSWDLIEAFVEKGAIVQPNWGMSEVGPLCINATFRTKEDIEKYKHLGEYIMGDTFYVDYSVESGGRLFIKSPMCVYNDWFETGDIVELINGVMFYKGRTNANG
jgi:acyl-coenzyme A synthetase/AMP-(fatty) acid ligase